MQNTYSLLLPCNQMPIAACLLAMSMALASAANVTWDAEGGTDKNWSTFSNWSSNASPVGESVYFGDTGSGSSSTVGSIANNPTANSTYEWRIDSLTFNNNSATNWQVLQIDSGVTLTVDANETSAPSKVFSVGGYDLATGPKTFVKITGGGSLAVNETGSIFEVASYDSSGGTNTAFATLDMSGLASFSANVSDFRVGYGQESSGAAYLATSNTITTGKFVVGDTSGSGGNSPTSGSFVYLGAQNTINATSIYIGAASNGVTNKTSGTLQFNAGLSGSPSVVIRGQGGGDTDRANLTIATMSGSSGTNISGTVDFTLGTVDAMIGNLLIAQGSRNGTSGGVTGTLSMDAGRIDATSVLLGETTGSGSTNATATRGIINVAGGTFTAGSFVMAKNTQAAQAIVSNLNISGTGAVSVTGGGITMGSKLGTAVSILPTINLKSGSLAVAGDIAEGTGGATISSRVTLDGGSLDLGGHAIAVDTFDVLGGTLKNVTGITTSSATGLVKTGPAGILRLAGSNSYSGGTTINAGTLVVDSGALVSGGTNDITINSGGALALNFSGIQSTLNSRVVESSTGSIALTAANAAENIDFSSTGANLANAYLGAVDRVVYTGTYTTYDGTYRLGGGLGELNFASAITGSSSVEIGGGPGIVELTGANDYTGATTLKAATLRLLGLDDLGGSTLAFDGGALQWASGFSGDISSRGPVTIGAGGATFDTNGNNVALASGIGNGGAGGLTKAGAGTLTLSGANSYAGPTVINKGTLTIASGGSINSASSLTLGGGTLDVAAAAQTLGNVTITGSTASQISVQAGSALTLGNTWTRNAGSTVSITLGAGSSIASDASANLQNGILPYATISGTDFATVSGGNIVAYTGYKQVASNGASIGSDPTGNYKVTSSGTTPNLKGAVINSILLANSGGTTGLYNDTSVTLGTVGTIYMTAASQAASIGKGTSINVGSITAGSDVSNASGELLVIQESAHDLTFYSIIANHGTGVVSLTKSGSGKLIIASTTGNYTGATVINGGTVEAAALADGGITSSIGASSRDASNLVLNGGTLRYTGAQTITDRNFTVGGNGGAIDASGTGALLLMGGMTASATSGTQTFTLTGTSTADNTLAGSINDGAGSVTSLTKSGVGKWIVSGNNDYSGSTVVSEGSLIINGSLNRTSGVSVSAAASVGGSGSVNSSLSLASSATLAMEINGAAAVTGYDQLTVSGAISLDNSNLALSLDYAPVAGQSFLLINNTGSEAIDGLFSTVNGVAFGSGNTFSLTYDSVEYDFTLSYTGGTGNDLVVQAVPEPSTWVLLAVGFFAVRFVFRRRNPVLN